jgi:chemotaxis protein methyltransferase CheR
MVRDRSAIVLESGKEYLVESRLIPLAKQEGLNSIENLVTELKLQRFSSLHNKVVEAMTTNETTFFRDIYPFEILRTEVLPKLILNRASERRLAIWCAATSSGQEPYSIAMILREHFPELESWDVRIIATDISQGMLARTRDAIYSEIEVGRGLPAQLREKYFHKKDDKWQAKDFLCQMIETKEMNLSGDWPPLPLMDIVFIRNVMIYFDVETKKAILGKVRKLLRSDGVMFMGTAETTIYLDDEFERVQFDKATYYRIRGRESSLIGTTVQTLLA